MLGQPISMLLPQVIGFKLGGELPEGSTATDLVLTVTEMLREQGRRLQVRRVLRPRAPEPDARRPGDDREHVAGVRLDLRDLPDRRRDAPLPGVHGPARPSRSSSSTPTRASRASSTSRTPRTRPTPTCSSSTSATSCRASPGRSAPRTGSRSRTRSRRSSRRWRSGIRRPAKQLGNMRDDAIDESFPASDPPAEDHDSDAGKPRRAGQSGAVAPSDRRTSDAITVQLEGGETVELDHGHVVIAAITSCTNTSNPSVMLAAGLVAKKAVERGLRRQPWVKTSLAPGSTVVTEYLEKSGLDKYLNQLQFNLVGYGCTTCIGNSGPLPEEISEAVNEKDLVVCSVLSGNRNFEGRINPDTRANYLASPPLVVAYALAGRMDIDLTTERARPRRRRRAGLPERHLADDARRSTRRDRAGGPRRHVHQELLRRLHRRQALEADRGPRGRPLHLARLDLRAPALLLRGDEGRARAGEADRGRPRARRCSATRSPPTTSRRPARSRRTAPPAPG